MIHEIRNVLRVSGSGCDDGGPFGLAAWNFTGGALRKKIVELAPATFSTFQQP